jgi:hypothetical protein
MFRAIFIVFAAALAIAAPAASASAGDEPVTGSRLGNKAAMVMSVGEIELDSGLPTAQEGQAARFAGMVADCVADRHPDLVDRYLLTHGEEAAAIWKQMDPSYTSCFKGYVFAMRYWGGANMRVPEFMLRGELADARVRKIPHAELDPAPRPQIVDTAAWMSTETSNEMLEAAGACASDWQPAASEALLRTTRGSKSEANLLMATLPNVKQCVPKGQVLRVSVAQLRAAMALGLFYRLKSPATLAQVSEKN